MSSGLKVTQQDHLLSKYSGTGNPDTTKHEWVTHHNRDTFAYTLANEDMLLYLSAATDMSRERLKDVFVSKMYEGCGPAPPKEQHNLLLRDFMPSKKPKTDEEEIV